MREHVNLGEAKAETITAAFIVVLLAAFFLTNLSDALIMTLAGLVLLGSGVYQTTRGWHVSLITWLLGIVLTLGGLGVRLFVVAVAQINYVAVVLVLLGVYLAWQIFVRKR